MSEFSGPSEAEIGISQDSSSEFILPHGELALKGFEKRHRDNPHAEALTAEARDLEQRFVESSVNNIDVFSSDGVSMPFTVVDATEIAERVNRSLPPIDASLSNNENDGESSEIEEREPKTVMYVIEPSFYQQFSGGPFTFTEYALNRFFKSEFSALQAIRKGRKPDRVLIYTLGAPTNYLGSVSPEWVQQFKGNEFESLGKLYADFIQNELGKASTKGGSTAIELQGHSASSSYALATAQELLERGAAVQEKQDGVDLPQLQLLLDNPTGMNDTYGGPTQNRLGFLADSAAYAVTHPGAVKIAFGEDSFMKQIAELPHLKEKRIMMDNDEQQRELKKTVLHQLEERITHGEPFAEDVVANVRYSTRDLTTFSLEKNLNIWKERQANKQKTGIESPTYIRRNEDNPNLREFPNRGTHNPEWFRKNVMDQWGRAAAYILRQKGVDAHIDKLG